LLRYLDAIGLRPRVDRLEMEWAPERPGADATGIELPQKARARRVSDGRRGETSSSSIERAHGASVATVTPGTAAKISR
jgi:hypothetical protein